MPGLQTQAYVDIDSLLRPVYGHQKQGASFGHTKIAGRQILRKGLSPLATTLSTEHGAPVDAARAKVPVSMHGKGTQPDDAGKKFRASLGGVKEWLRANRSRPVSWIGEKLAAKLRGYWNYYGVIGNSVGLNSYWREVRNLCWKWLNRRSQRRSYGTQGFEALWKEWQLPSPRIVEVPYRPRTM